MSNYILNIPKSEKLKKKKKKKKEEEGILNSWIH